MISFSVTTSRGAVVRLRLTGRTWPSWRPAGTFHEAVIESIVVEGQEVGTVPTPELDASLRGVDVEGLGRVTGAERFCTCGQYVGGTLGLSVRS